MYYFKLHPTKREFEKDSETIFKVSRMEDGNYKVIIDLDDNTHINDTLSAEEVLLNILENYWVLVEVRYAMT